MKLANSENPDETVHKEPSHLEFHCCKCMLNLPDIRSYPTLAHLSQMDCLTLISNWKISYLNLIQEKIYIFKLVSAAEETGLSFALWKPIRQV